MPTSQILGSRSFQIQFKSITTLKFEALAEALQTSGGCFGFDVVPLLQSIWGPFRIVFWGNCGTDVVVLEVRSIDKLW